MHVSLSVLLPIITAATLFSPSAQDLRYTILAEEPSFQTSEYARTLVTEITPEAMEEAGDEATANERDAAERHLPEILIRIAECESGNRQFDENGNVIRGKINPLDVGRFQINLSYHGERAEELGIDLFTREGNTKFALILYKENGVSDWGWSRECWSKYYEKQPENND